jgi:hypothetical protein
MDEPTKPNRKRSRQLSVYHISEEVWQDLNDASHTLSLPKNRIIDDALGVYLEKLKDEQEALGKPWLKAPI